VNAADKDAENETAILSRLENVYGGLFTWDIQYTLLYQFD